ncbi:hypothetical protein KIL84_010553 [Mauremys mutica]|uniref:Uncharacterized protein n=1 Tax=Mauremys mutica TaxID=74926 RepID=A0A9D4B1I0_9SAUR|nr:hypothetical protein KIL84_010553 [Mauremys mutica]
MEGEDSVPNSYSNYFPLPASISAVLPRLSLLFLQELISSWHPYRVPVGVAASLKIGTAEYHQHIVGSNACGVSPSPTSLMSMNNANAELRSESPSADTSQEFISGGDFFFLHKGRHFLGLKNCDQG